MTATLKRANDEGGYFMTDSSTWVAEKKNNPQAANPVFRRQEARQHLPRPVPSDRRQASRFGVGRWLHRLRGLP